MKPWIVALVVVLPCLGCGGAAAGLVPVIAQAVNAAAELVKQRTGNDLSQYPMTCEHEYDPEDEELLILCEIDLSKSVTK